MNKVNKHVTDPLTLMEKPTVTVKEIMKRYPMAANEVIDFARWFGMEVVDD